jgi:integrase
MAADLDPRLADAKALVFTVLRQVLDYAASPRRGYIVTNPATGLTKREKPKQTSREHRLIAADELERLLGGCERFPWLRPIIQVALTTGMRLGELLALRWQDIDFERGVIHVRHTVGTKGELAPPKNNRPRTIDLYLSTRSVLVGLATLEAQPTDYVFVNGRNRPRTRSEVQRAFEKARERACLSTTPRQLCFHDLRHTHASALLNDGAKSIVYVSKRLGHASVKITLDTYAHVIRSEEHAAAAEAKLAEAFGALLAA